MSRPTALPSDLEIASSAILRPMADVAADLGVAPEHVEPYGRDVAKIDLAAAAEEPRGKYVVVSAITPTPLGEGKTTVVVGLTQALRRLGSNAVATLRQPSMGPTFGIKGGAAGGGYSQVVPMERLNLHLTGDFHAITAAHNLLAAAVDNHLHFGNELGLDLRNITWRRVMDVNDRSLRNIVVGLGARADGLVRETGFDITAASEVMVLMTLATSYQDMRARLGRIVVGYTVEGKPVSAEDLGVAGAMAVILRDALKPNLLQTLEGGPALIDIAHWAAEWLWLPRLADKLRGLEQAPEVTVSELREYDAVFGASPRWCSSRTTRTRSSRPASRSASTCPTTWSSWACSSVAWSPTSSARWRWKRSAAPPATAFSRSGSRTGLGAGPLSIQ